MLSHNASMLILILFHAVFAVFIVTATMDRNEYLQTPVFRRGNREHQLLRDATTVMRVSWLGTFMLFLLDYAVFFKGFTLL